MVCIVRVALTRVIAIVSAVALGAVLFPVVLVFPPSYWPETLLVLAAGGAIVGLTVSPVRHRLPFALGLAVLTFAAVLTVLIVTRNVGITPSHLPWWTVWIGGPIAVGATLGTAARRRLGLARGVAALGCSCVVLAVVGAALAVVVAPQDVVGAPTCDGRGGLDCLRAQCAYMAERRRLGAVERVVAFDGARMTCGYTAWFGLDVGRADVDGRGARWTDGWWPVFVLGRGR
jgi:hypothetical protein